MEPNTVYRKYYTANLWPHDSNGYPDPANQVGILQLHFNGEAIAALELLKREVEDAIVWAKKNPW